MSCWFDGCTVMLTGASSGIGLELARLLVIEHGCLVIGTGRNVTRLNAVCRELGSSFIPCPFDVTDRSKWLELSAGLEEQGINIDMLINNAGIMPPFTAYPGNGGLSVLRRVTEVNYLAQAAACEAMLPHLLLSPCGALINMSSAAALAPLPGTAAYSASKAASLAFTEALAEEYRGIIYVGAVCPGMTDTPLFNAQRGSEEFADFSMDPKKMAAKILRGIRRRRRRIIRGTDAFVMRFLRAVAGTGALRLFSSVLRRHGGDMFAEAFADTYFGYGDEDTAEAVGASEKQEGEIAAGTEAGAPAEGMDMDTDAPADGKNGAEAAEENGSDKPAGEK